MIGTIPFIFSSFRELTVAASQQQGNKGIPLKQTAETVLKKLRVSQYGSYRYMGSVCQYTMSDRYCGNTSGTADDIIFRLDFSGRIF